MYYKVKSSCNFIVLSFGPTHYTLFDRMVTSDMSQALITGKFQYLEYTVMIWFSLFY